TYPLKKSRPEIKFVLSLCHLTVAADYFFNNDLEYLNSSDLERMYTTSIMKKKAARCDIVGIEDMVPILWSTIKHGVKKLHGYGHLEEVVGKRAARQLYKFKEGNFMDLHLNNIEDMMILAVQHKLFHLNDSDIVEFIMALYKWVEKKERPFTLRKKWVNHPLSENTKMLSGMKIVIHGPVIAMPTLPSHSSDDGNPSGANIKQSLRCSSNEYMQAWESNRSVLEDPTLLAQNPLKEEALGGYTRDLDSFGKKRDKIVPLQRSGFKNILTESRDGVAIS
ncbi:hypothetical protein Tco_0946050, partial [Tanacetum coccineum]